MLYWIEIDYWFLHGTFVFISLVTSYDHKWNDQYFKKIKKKIGALTLL
jgi:hypothetical protein